MGYSASSAAFKTINRLMHRKRLESGLLGVNYWIDANGFMVFFEVGRENRDGAMTGTVFRGTEPGRDGGPVKRLGTFRVDRDGQIKRFPGLPAKEIATLNAFARGEMFVVE